MGLSMVVSGIYLLPFGVSPMVEHGLGKYRSNKRVAEVMSKLAPDEKRLVRQFYFPAREGHIMAWPHEVGKLESDGVLFSPGETGLKDTMKTYCLTPSASKYAAKHRDFLAELEKTKPTRY
jgi:hypothetical protein